MIGSKIASSAALTNDGGVDEMTIHQDNSSNERDYKCEDGGTAMDVKLFKAIGMYQLLHPVECGLNSDLCRKTAMMVVGLTVGLQLMQVFRLYLARHDIPMFANMAMLVVYGFMCLLKGYTLANHADRICITLEVARYAFTDCGRRDPSLMRRCRARLSTILRTFVGLSFGTLVVWLVMPWFLASEYDGKPLIWAVVYVVESIILTVNVFCWTSFDCYLVTMCFVFEAIFRTMSSGYEKVGRGQPIHPHTNQPFGDHRRSDSEVKANVTLTFPSHYDDLISHIKDNQKIVEKYKTFFEIVTPTVLLQIADGSYTIITMIFLISIAYLNGNSILSPMILKYVCGLVSLTIELYIFCYAFNYIEDGRSTVNFGLYSCDWTDKDLKFKKTVLLAMSMNSANKQVMKLSPNSIVNLAMFSRVMNMSYTIVSTLLS
ncbi:uncharacterized protein LOC100572802 [Acyrthosiphon pisum]|uniref:Odorant receptor n=1 Tax=Acyrthosiphon pisum TaxID=7029 RepID=A0A8R2JM50_ACYPI|nr:uncharacterized protein LOC100572802 [Acyrthosiphon pisum]